MANTRSRSSRSSASSRSSGTGRPRGGLAAAETSKTDTETVPASQAEAVEVTRHVPVASTETATVNRPKEAETEAVEVDRWKVGTLVCEAQPTDGRDYCREGVVLEAVTRSDFPEPTYRIGWFETEDRYLPQSGLFPSGAVEGVNEKG